MSTSPDTAAAPNKPSIEASSPAPPRGVLVLGWSSPIGRAICGGFSAGGDTVTGIALETEDSDALHHTISADCSDPEQARRSVKEALTRMGRLDVVVVAAGSMPVASVSATTDRQWRSAMGANLDSAFFLIRESVPHFAPGASIVAVSSVNSFLAAPGLSAYSAAKGGLDALIRQIALELGPQGVRANAVAPGLIGGLHLENASAGYPLGRTGTPREVADAVVFLASAQASFINGVVLAVDGGLSIASPAAFIRPDLRERFLTGDAHAAEKEHRNP